MIINSIHYPCIDSRLNPYNDLLLDSLNNVGCHSQACNSIYSLYRQTLLKKANILHFHWLDRAGGSINFRLPKLAWQASILLLLIIARVLRIRSVWTVHNLYRHNSVNQSTLFYQTVASLVNVLITHSPVAVDQVSTTYNVPLKKISCIPHGLYPNGLKVSPIVDSSSTHNSHNLRLLYFGNISPYKGLDLLASSLRSSSQILGPLKPILTVIGQLDRSKYPTLAQSLLENDNVTIVSDFADDNTLNSYLQEADLVILPFRNTLTSGSLLYALSAGKPILISNLPSLGYYLSSSYSFTFESENCDSLSRAIVHICTQQTRQSLYLMGINARNYALTLDWSSIAQETFELYHSN